MMDAQQLGTILALCGGSEERHAYGRAWITDGVKLLAHNAECWWLVDLVISHQWGVRRRHGVQMFQSWTLTRNKRGSGAVAKCTDGNGLVLAQQRIPYTDFPLQSVDIYVVGDLTDFNQTIMLSSEY